MKDINAPPPQSPRDFLKSRLRRNVRWTLTLKISRKRVKQKRMGVRMGVEAFRIPSNAPSHPSWSVVNYTLVDVKESRYITHSFLIASFPSSVHSPHAPCRKCKVSWSQVAHRIYIPHVLGLVCNQNMKQCIVSLCRKVWCYSSLRRSW